MVLWLWDLPRCWPTQLACSAFSLWPKLSQYLLWDLCLHTVKKGFWKDFTNNKGEQEWKSLGNTRHVLKSWLTSQMGSWCAHILPALRAAVSTFCHQRSYKPQMSLCLGFVFLLVCICMMGLLRTEKEMPALYSTLLCASCKVLLCKVVDMQYYISSFQQPYVMGIM